MNSKPVRYRGVAFRSTLEARWAKFFDTLLIDWQYEPRPFVVDGSGYLPDFWLPKFGLWVEIKPWVDVDYKPSDLDPRLKKIWGLYDELWNSPEQADAIAIIGNPADYVAYVRTWYEADSSAGPTTAEAFFDCMYDEAVVAIIRPDRSSGDFTDWRMPIVKERARPQNVTSAYCTALAWQFFEL